MQSVEQLLTELSDLTRLLLKLALILAVSLLVSRIGWRLIGRFERDGHFTPVMAGRLQTARRWSVLCAVALVVLQLTGLFQNAWAFLSAVLAAVAIGFFAIWSFLSNITSALILVMYRPFRVGDQIEIIEPTNGTRLGGRVADMNLMFTTLAMKDEGDTQESLLHVPNNLFLQKTVRSLPAPTRTPTDTFFHDSMMDLESPLKDGSRARSWPPKKPRG